MQESIPAEDVSLQVREMETAELQDQFSESLDFVIVMAGELSFREEIDRYVMDFDEDLMNDVERIQESFRNR